MHRRRAVLYATIPVVVFLLFAEAVARIVLHWYSVHRPGPFTLSPAYSLTILNTDSRMVPDPYCGYRIRESGDPRSRRPPRAPFPPKAPGEVRVLCLGDSGTYDILLPEDQAWPARLQGMMNAWAPAGTRFEVYNAGVPGYAPQQVKRLFQSRYVDLHPDIVLWREASEIPDGPELPPPRSLVAIRATQGVYRSRLVYGLALGYRLAMEGRWSLVNLPPESGAGFSPNVMTQFVRWCRDRGVRAFVAVEPVSMAEGSTTEVKSFAGDGWSATDVPVVRCVAAFRDAPGGPAALFPDGSHFSAAGAELQARVISDFLREHWAELGISP